MGTLHDADIVIGAQIDTEQAEKSAQGLTRTLSSSLSQGASQSGKASALVSAGLNTLSVAAGNLLSQLARTAAQAIATVVNTGLEFNQQMENYSLAFENLLGDAGAAADALAAIKEDAAKTPFDVAGLVSANRLLISTGQSAEQARQVINALGNAVSASGGGNEELQRMAANLQQIANVGKAEAVDIKQFAYAGIDIYGLLADYTGKTREEVQNLTISYDLLAAALTAASAEGGRYAGAMEAYSQTLQGRMDTLGDNAAQLAGALTEGLFQAQGELVAAAAGWVETLKETLEAQGPGAMAAAGVQIAAEMVLGLVQAAPELAVAAAQLMADFLSGIFSNLPAIANAGGQMIAHLILGFFEAKFSLWGAVLEIVESIIDFFLSGDFISVGIQFLAGIARGMSDALPQMIDTVYTTVGRIMDKAIEIVQNGWDIIKRIFAGEGGEVLTELWDSFKTEIDKAANPYHRGSEKDQSYWEKVAEHYRKTGQDQRQGSYLPAAPTVDPAAPTVVPDFSGLGKTAGAAAKQVETLADKLAKADKALSGSRSAYDALTDAVTEYNETGRISVGTWQEIMGLAPEYQALLTKEGGKLKINEQAYASLSAAQRLEIETLAAQNGTTAETIALLDEMIAGTENAVPRLKAAQDELAETWGGSSLAKLADLASNLLRGNFADALADAGQIVWEKLDTVTQQALVDMAQGWLDTLEEAFVQDGFAGLAEAGRTIAASIAEGLQDDSSATGSLLNSVLSQVGISGGVEGLLGVLAELGPLVLGVVAAVAAVAAGLAGVGAAISYTVQQSGELQAALQEMTAQFSATLADLGLKLMETMTPIIHEMMDIVLPVLDSLRPALEAVGDLLITLLTLFGSLATSLMTALQPILQAVGPLLASLATLLNAVASIVLQLVSPALQFLGQMLNWLLQPILWVANAIQSVVSSIVNSVNSLLRFLGLSPIGSAHSSAVTAPGPAYSSAAASPGSGAMDKNTGAIEDNTEAIKEQTDLIRNPPRYQTGGGGPSTGVLDYSAMLAAARAAILGQNGRVVSNYDAGSGHTAARLNASWRGTSTTVLNLDGREVARATKDYMDEELAF